MPLSLRYALRIRHPFGQKLGASVSIMNSSFAYETVIRMHNVDAAQRLFFADQFVIVHDAWEAYLDSVGFSIGAILETEDFVLPIVHAESDYSTPVRLGDCVRVALCCERVGTTSFTVCFDLTVEDIPVGHTKHVHTAVSKATGLAIPLPEAIRDLLARLSPTDAEPGRAETPDPL